MILIRGCWFSLVEVTSTEGYVVTEQYGKYWEGACGINKLLNYISEKGKQSDRIVD